MSQNSEQQVTSNIDTTELSVEELTAELNAIRESQKKLQKLAELEGDLMTILNELANQSQIQQRPAEFRSETSIEKVDPDPPLEPLTDIVIKPKPNKEPTGKGAEQKQEQQQEQQTLNANYQNNERVAPALTFKPSDHVLWLGFYISENAAIAGMNRLQDTFNFQRQNLRIAVVSNANQRGQYYGLMMGSFQNQRQATSYCSSLSRYGQYCKVRQIPAL